jgi:DNA-binding MurR/RpiR family transcriptional regulator
MRTFSKGQRRIAEYILSSYDKAAFMTAGALGQTAKVSESTVVRFAAELGYDGYPSMQKALQEMVLNRLTSVQRIAVTTQRMGQQDVVSTVLQSDIEKIRTTSENLNREVFQKAVDSIIAANKIYILGVRSSSALASFLGFYMHYMFENVQVITTSSGSEMFEQIVAVSPRDAVIGISFPRYSTSTSKALAHCSQVGAQVIALTDSPSAPIARSADYVLTAKSDMVSLVDSLVAPMSLINALIVAIASRRKQEVEEKFSTLERIWDSFHVYEKIDV